MRKELILFLSCLLVLTAMLSVVNAKDSSKLQNTANHMIFPFDDDPFFQAYDDVFNQMKLMQQTMDNIINRQFEQINNKHLGLMNLKNSLSVSEKDVQMEERNNELIYKIKQPQGNDSKVNVSFKDGILIINTQLTQKKSLGENGSKTYSYSQSNYNRSFKLPKGYDPKSMDVKSKDNNLIVTFKKQNVSNALIT